MWTRVHAPLRVLVTLGPAVELLKTCLQKVMFGKARSLLAALRAATEYIAVLWRVQLAQAVLVPLLVDKDNVGPSGMKAITNMMTMRPTPDFNVIHLPFAPPMKDCSSPDSCCSLLSLNMH